MLMIRFIACRKGGHDLIEAIATYPAQISSIALSRRGGKGKVGQGAAKHIDGC
jgi:hypothetical protein